jgi:hypothetical protein
MICASGKTERMPGRHLLIGDSLLHDHRSTHAVGFVSVLLFAIPVVISSSMFLRMPK